MHRIKMMLLVLAFFATTGVAQEDQEPANKLASKFDFHGFITQAYAFRESGSPQIFGISEDGTLDYRNIALQASYAPTGSDRFVVQLANSRRGEAPFQDFMDDIELDWAFYQHYFNNDLTLRVGRVPIPIGIYNEVRDVGALLPFFTPPITLYAEVQFAQEAIDGAVVGKKFFSQSPWELSAEVYAGVWEKDLSAEPKEKIEDAVGVQLWVRTPVQDLRVGLGANQYGVTEGTRAPGVVDTWKNVVFSVDGDFQRFLARGEAYYRKVPFDVPFLGGRTDFETWAFHVQLGYYLTPKLRVYVQHESAGVETELPFLGKLEDTVWQDTALSVHYAFLPQLLLKAEYHVNQGFFRENTTETRLPFFEPPYEGDYGIVSLSTSF